MLHSKLASITTAFLLMLCIASPSLPAASVQSTPQESKDFKTLAVIFPATLCSTEMPDELIAMFEKEYNIPIKKINLCTGDADKLIRSDSKEPIDVLIGHDREAEDKLISDGYLVNIREVMYSNYVLVGPKGDPAGIKGMKAPTEALKIIKTKKALFFSRGDNSGTHGLEKHMWKLAKIQPKGDWYITTNAGTDATLVIANRKKGYTIVHYPSFIQQLETLDMDIMVDGNKDNKLITSYEVMAANPQKYPDAHYIDAMTFIGYITSPRIQKYIGDFGIQKFKRQTNFPMAVSGTQKGSK
jgi:tungstate transport system substrate-binding protein